MTTHHLDDATLISFASGTLNEAFSITAACHIAACSLCHQRLHALYELGGHLLEAENESTIEEGMFDRILKQLPAASRKATATRVAQPDEVATSDVPTPLRRHIGDRLDGIKWRSVAPGVARHVIHTNEASGEALYMLKIAARTKVPEHGHGGSEMTFILSGAYRDDLGLFQAGDIADLDEHIEHQPQVVGDAPCICLVATEAPTRFKGHLSRLLQPFIGI